MEGFDDLRARLTSQVGGRPFNFHLVCGNQKVIPIARAYARKLVTDPCRCAGHDCKLPDHLGSPFVSQVASLIALGSRRS